MSFGTVIPLFVFLGGYVVNLTIVGAPLARRIYRYGIWTSTLGQDPPGASEADAGGEDDALGRRTIAAAGLST